MLIKSETGVLQPLTSEALCGGKMALSPKTRSSLSIPGLLLLARGGSPSWP